MSWLLWEPVVRMPPMAMATLEELSAGFLEEVAPETLQRPMPIDLVRLVDERLPRHGIHVSPASSLELEDREGATDPSGEGEIEILILDDLYDRMMVHDRRAFRPRSTILHEVAHAVLHVPVIRRRRRMPNRTHLLNRIRRCDLAPYEDPEWQAFALAGCLAVPRTTLTPLIRQGYTVEQLSRTFGVSAKFIRSHLRRLKLCAKGG